MTTTEPSYAELPIGQVVPNPEQPRRHFDADALAELGRSIADQGLLQPIAVRPLPDGTHMLIAGERRWRAAQLAGLTTISARVLHGLTDTEAFTLSVLENVARRDMHPTEEARAYAVLRGAGRTVEQIAESTGKSTRWVVMFLDLLDCVPEIQHLLDGGGIKIGVAWAVSRCSPDGQRSLLRRHVRGEFASDMDAQAFASALLAAEQQTSMFDDPETEAEKDVLVIRKQAMLTKIDRVAMAGFVLSEIAAMDPKLVARLLAGHRGGVAAHRESIRDVVRQANKALSVLRKAAALADVATVTVTVTEETT